MASLVHVGTGYSSHESLLRDIRDLEIRGSGSAMRVYSATGAGGGLLVWNPAAGYATADYEYTSGTTTLGAQYRLEYGALNGVDYLFYYGAANAQVTAYRIATDGTLTKAGTLPVGLGSVLGFEAVSLANGKTAVYTSASGSGLVSGFTASALGTLAAINTVNLGVEAETSALTDLKQVTVEGNSFLLAVSMYGNSLVSLRIGTNGSTAIADSIGIPDGLAVDRLYRIETVTVAGKTFAVIAATGTGSIAVAEIGSDGNLSLRDQVNDDLETRFQAVSSLATAELDGRAYVVAAGADDGLSLFMILPNGRMLHLDTLADDGMLALDNVSALAMTGVDGVLDIFATSQSETGLTHLRYDPGEQAALKTAATSGGVLAGDTQADLLWGGAGADTLYGYAGDDILYDGGGVDVLYGGAGADTFILARDGRIDTIRDFEIVQDRIDLSAWGTIYSLGFLDITATSYGLVIRYEGEELRVYSADGKTIDPARLTFDQVSNAWHVVLNLPQEDDALLIGTSAAEVLSTGAGNDTILGLGGSDTLIAGAGDDLLIGDTRDESYDLVAAQVFRLYRATLGRDPDEGGHTNWTRAIHEGGRTLESAASGFVTSKEFQTTYGSTTNAQFVTLLYNNVLGRAPDSTGFENWTNALASKALTREQVVLGFSESQEFKLNTSDQIHGFTRLGHQMDWSGDVFRLYQATLGRMPDLAGLLNWTARLADGMSYETAVSGFVNSAEFQSKYGATTNAEFVTLLYNNVLGRAPDPTGLQNWTAQLNTGAMSREQVVAGFAQSIEFKAATGTALLGYMRTAGLDDHLYAGSGTNLLVGGMLADTFEFHRSDGGSHTVGDLERWDLISLEGFGYGSTAEALTHFSTDGENAFFADQGFAITFIDAAGGIYADMLLI